MMRPHFTGSLVALLTPFRDGAIEWDAFGALIDAQIGRASCRERVLFAV